jgi:hypothetical protein
MHYVEGSDVDVYSNKGQQKKAAAYRIWLHRLPCDLSEAYKPSRLGKSNGEEEIETLVGLP